VRKEAGQQLRNFMGEQSAKTVESMMASEPNSHKGLLTTIVGGVALILGAAGVFGQLQDALNTIWEVKPRPGKGMVAFVRQRFLSMTMVLGIGFLLLISMVLSAIVSALAGYLSQLISLPPWVMQAVNEGVSFLVATLLFALIFKVLPDVKIGWRDVWIGAFGTALLFTLGKFLLGLYLGRESASAYGAGTAFVLVLTYIYYSSVILFLGAEFTQVYARCTGAQIEPTAYAMRVTETDRAQEGMPRKASTDAGSTPKPGDAGHPQPAYASTMGSPEKAIMQTTQKAEDIQNAPHRAPAEHIRAQPWSFVGLALITGVAAGFLLKFKTLRRAVSLYAALRR